MFDQNSPPIELGATKVRKPSTAFNLSFLIAGLGQIYSGCFKRGLLHLVLISGLLLIGIVLLATQFAYPLIMCITIFTCGTLVTAYSAFDARRMARQCREDYRLKEYNSIPVYAAISFLFFALVVGFTFNLRENFLHVFKMAGNSMSNTLVEGQRIFVRKDAYLRSDPKHNELIAFRNPGNRQQIWVKRVIGLPGDVVEIHTGEVSINGTPIQEPNTVRKDKADLAPITVPKNHCYVLGDHRANSNDSRRIGPIPMNALIGKVVGHH